MKRTPAFLAAIILCSISSVYALYSIADHGTWPKTWPAELEPLRKTSRTLVGPTVEQSHYEIPVTKREEFEAAWPHLLEVKSKEAPIFLVRSPYNWLGKEIVAGVVIHAPPAGTDKRVNPELPIAGVTNLRERWMNTTYIELIVDGNIVDLNRIPLPQDTPVIDQRFKDAQNKQYNAAATQPAN
jgi:hypothetical protein